MKTIFLIPAIVSLTFLLSCKNEELNLNLSKNESMSFRGTFETRDSEENLSGTVTLKIENGLYQSSTSLPGGFGAGKIEIHGNKINFIDTVFVPTPAIYGPSYTPSGEHYYKYDGESLKLWREKNVGSIEYRLGLTK
jgi:hypothetical protein